MRSPIGLKLGGDLTLVSQISLHVLVSRFDCFSYYKQTKEQKTCENRGFTKRVFSAVASPIDLKLGRDNRTSTRNSVVCLFCLYFVNINKENTLYGSFVRLQVKSFETWWMSSPNPNTQS
jgi:hypothetical protein